MSVEEFAATFGGASCSIYWRDRLFLMLFGKNVEEKLS